MLKKYNINKTLELFFLYPTRRFHLREISRELNISTPTVSSVIEKLEKENLVKRRKTLILDEVSANTESKEFVLKKRLFNIESLYSSGFVEVLVEQNPEAIILFGTYSRGEDIEKSDIDIAVVGKVKEMDLAVFEKRLKRKINIHQVDLKEVSKEFKNNLANGIVLEGYLSLL